MGRRLQHLAGLIAPVATVLLLSACGDESRTGPPGSPDNPMVARALPGTTEPAAQRPTGAPGYRDLVDGQSQRPAERFSPCTLVTRTQARAIVGEQIPAPLEAPQGPTCIYRGQSGETLATLAVETADISQLRRRLRGLRRVDVSDRDAFCGRWEQPVLYAPLTGARVLSIAAPCDVARRFAARALQRLGT